MTSGRARAELDEPPVRASLYGPHKGIAADKIAAFGFHREHEARIERRILIADVMAPVAIGLFDAAGIKRVQACEPQSMTVPTSIR